MEKNWSQLQILTNPENFELVTNALIIQQITGIENLNHDRGLAIYLPSEQLTKDWCHQLQITLNQLGLTDSAYQLQIIANVNMHWGQNWAPYYQPVRISHFMSIIPSWQKDLVQSPYDILMDPQESFGSGEHATTKLCLQALEEVVNHQESLIDVGTGTGILAIAAAKLGVKTLYGYDISDEAIVVAQKNFNLNCPQEKFQVAVNSLLDNITNSAEIITANMLEEPIRALIPQLAPHLKANGHVIISGILETKIADITQLLKQEHLAIIKTSAAQGWGCIIAQKERR